MLDRTTRANLTIAPESAGRGHHAAVRRVLAGLWRQRWLVLAPVISLSPIVVAAAFLLPQTFVARTLLLLQERSTAARPLAAPELGADLYRDKQPALEALLKSDYLLQRALEHSGAPKPVSQREMGQQIAELRRSLSASAVGQDFLELRLQGTNPTGLGDQLQTITAVMLETLMAQSSQATAPSLVIANYKRDVERAEAEQAQAKSQLEAALRGPADPGPSGQALANEQREDSPRRPADVAGVDQLRQQVASAEAALAARRTALSEAEERYSKYNAHGAPGLLAAPERILVVDPPTDPLFPKYSKSIIAVGGLAALIVSGLLLAFLAEAMDPRVREVSEFEAILTAPVVARLPRFDAPVAPAPARGGRWRRLSVILAVLALAAALIAARNGSWHGFYVNVHMSSQ